MKFLQVEGYHLLNTKGMCVSLLSEFESNFVVLHCHYFMGTESGFEFKLGLALGVETKVACWEDYCVLEVLLNLGLHGVSN